MSSSSPDLAAVRAKFPALGQPQVYFDNAGGSQTLGAVIDSIREYLTNTNVQLGASYVVGRKSTARYNAGYEAGAKYINAFKDDIGKNVSYSLKFEPGDELILSAVDHEANIASWVDLAERQNLVIKWWKSEHPTNPKLTPETLKELLSPKTRLVACTHASNILGTIHDIKSLADVVHQAVPRALICVDGVAFAPHRAIDVKDLGVDLYAFSWYKVYGPHIAMLYASPKAQSQINSLGHFFNPSNTLENKLGLAGSSYELVAAIPPVLTYLGTSGSATWTSVMHQEHQLQEVLLQYLNGRKDVTIYGETSSDPNSRVPTVSFRVKGWKSKELLEAIEKDTSFGLKSGSFYSYRLVKEFLGLDPVDGVVRVSMVHYNSLDEIKSFVSALHQALSQKKP